MRTFRKDTSIPDLPRQKTQEETIFDRPKLKESDLKRMVREMGLKVTAQRIAILQALHQGKQHVTAQEVFESVHEEFPEVGFATVYRFLRALAEYGSVTELRMGGLPARYELAPQSHHDHLTCLECGKILEFENKSIEKLQELVANQLGFELQRHVLELFGKCKDGKCPNRGKRFFHQKP